MGQAFAAGVEETLAEVDTLLEAMLPAALKTAHEAGRASKPAKASKPVYPSSRRGARKPVRSAAWHTGQTLDGSISRPARRTTINKTRNLFRDQHLRTPEQS